MAVSDWQAQYGTLLIGPGTDYAVMGIRGLDDLPDLRLSDVPRPSDHGLFPGRDLTSGRTVEIDLEIRAATPALFRADVDALDAATIVAAAETALSFKLPGQSGARRVNCRPRKRSLPVDQDYSFGVGRAKLSFAATDPRIYDDTETVLTTAAATSGGGRTYNRVYNMTYAAGGTGGTVSAANAGTFPTRPTLKVTGPCNTPRMENIEAGTFLAFNLTLAAGEFLTIDMDARTVLLGGTASRYSTIATGSTWWQLAAGTNTIRFTSADTQGTLEVRYRSAWL